MNAIIVSENVSLVFRAIEGTEAVFNVAYTKHPGAGLINSPEFIGECLAVPAPYKTETDTHGFPHTARIHADTKRKNKDGTWRVKRNASALLIAAIEAAYRSVGW